MSLVTPMKAYSKTPPLEVLKYPLLASPKLDGIRCTVQGGEALSRSLKIIPNVHVQETLAKFNIDGFDGELMVKGDFNSVQSAIMSREGKPDFYYRVFDDIHFMLPFKERYELLKCRVSKLPSEAKEVVSVVSHELICSAEELRQYWYNCIELGYEGVIVRCPKGRYKQGRSTLKEGWMVKLKQWFDDEAKVVGFNELQHNENDPTIDNTGLQVRSHEVDGLIAGDALGSLKVLWRGKEFNLGSGFTADQRDDIWLYQEKHLNKRVTFKYQELSKYGIPRFPIFKGFRHE